MTPAAPGRPARAGRPVFPDSDGQPMADNTLQYEWISTIKWNLEHLFADDPDVFVAGDNLIYPTPDDAAVRAAPDVYVAFGRPKGYRGSYKVWEEEGVFPQVIFEVWSPGNTRSDMDDRRAFYERYGAEEFYLIYPDHPAFVQGWWREDGHLRRTLETNGFISPRLGVRFHMIRGELTLYGPDGRPFHNPARIAADRDRAEQAAADAKAQAEETIRRQIELAQLAAAAQQVQLDATQIQASAERQRADEALRRAERLAAKLRELGVDPDA